MYSCSAVSETLQWEKYGYCESHSFDNQFSSCTACENQYCAVSIVNIKCFAWHKNVQLFL